MRVVVLAVMCMIVAALGLPTTTTASPPVIEWTQQFGTSGSDNGLGVSADGLGNVYISGTTEGGLAGGNAGESDVFLRKYDASGAIEWTRQFGTSGRDTSHGVSVDGMGNIYITGSTQGRLGVANGVGWDSFVSKYDASGTFKWIQQFGTSSDDLGRGVSADRMGNVYVSGYTQGSLDGANVGGWDAFVSKFDASGAIEWTRQFGTTARDESRGVSADGMGNVYVSGFTQRFVEGFDAGDLDAFLRKYDASGELGGR